MTLSDYSRLKEQVVETVITRDNHNNLLQDIKDFFKGGINSVRRFELIKTFAELLKVLEIRDLLSEDNVGPLKHIAQVINSEDLLNKISDYEASHVPREYINYYVSEKPTKSVLSECLLNNNAQTEGSIQDKKKERIYITVTEQIGSAWRDLARSLRIQECVIDEIDANHKTMASKACKMLKRFDSRADRQKWFYDLCEALDTIRRKELRYTVQEIMMMNI